MGLEEFRNALGAAIARGITARDIAQRIDVSVPTVERWINGIDYPHQAMFRWAIKTFNALG